MALGLRAGFLRPVEGFEPGLLMTQAFGMVDLCDIELRPYRQA
jgi:hypothetical protein